jgi:hypothetical protein
VALPDQLVGGVVERVPQVRDGGLGQDGVAGGVAGEGFEGGVEDLFFAGPEWHRPIADPLGSDQAA